MLGCGEGDHEQDISAKQILDLARLKDTLYLTDHSKGMFRVHNKTQSWEWMGTHGSHVLVVDKTTLYRGGYSDVYRLVGGENAYNFHQITPQGELQGHVVLAVDGETIYASWDDGQIFRTEDRGKLWYRLPSWPGSRTAELSWPREIKSSLVVRGNTIYVATVDDGVFGTLDGGKEWTAINTGLPDPHSVYSLLLSKNTLYAGTNNGVYRLTVGTTSFLPTGLHDKAVNSLVESPRALYAGSWNNGVFRSDDGGKNLAAYRA